MNKYEATVIVSFFICILIGGYLDKKLKQPLTVDFPEEIMEATTSDTLKAVRRGDTLYIEF